MTNVRPMTDSMVEYLCATLPTHPGVDVVTLRAECVRAIARGHARHHGGRTPITTTTVGTGTGVAAVTPTHGHATARGAVQGDAR